MCSDCGGQAIGLCFEYQLCLSKYWLKVKRSNVVTRLHRHSKTMAMLNYRKIKILNFFKKIIKIS